MAEITDGAPIHLDFLGIAATATIHGNHRPNDQDVVHVSPLRTRSDDRRASRR